MGIFDFGGLSFWLFGYVFDWWNESMVLFLFLFYLFIFFLLMINLVCFDLMNVV